MVYAWVKHEAWHVELKLRFGAVQGGPFLQLHLTNSEHVFEAMGRVFQRGIHDSPLMVEPEPSRD